MNQPESLLIGKTIKYSVDKESINFGTVLDKVSLYDRKIGKVVTAYIVNSQGQLHNIHSWRLISIED